MIGYRNTQSWNLCWKKLVGSLKMNTTLEYSTRVVQEGDRRCKKSTLNDLAYLTPLRIPLMNPVNVFVGSEFEIRCSDFRIGIPESHLRIRNNTCKCYF
jgi:hypothetical protein